MYKLESIRLLVAHESQDTAEQLINALRNGGRATRAELALDEAELVRALKRGGWDLFLCDESFGGCTLERAVEQVRRLGREVPVLAMVDHFDAAACRRVMALGAWAVAPEADHELILMQVDSLLRWVDLRRERRELEQNLREAERRLSVLMDQSRDAIAYVLDGMHIHANENYLELFGYQDADELAGVPIMDMVSAQDHAQLKQLLRSRAQDETQTQELECRGVNTQGEEFDAVFVFSPSSWDGEACTQIVIRTPEVDEAVIEQRLQELAQKDGVTGLPYRQVFGEWLEEALGEAEQSMMAVFCLRVDAFERHLGLVGMDGGDEALRLVAAALEKLSAGRFRMARLGDEEFGILTPVTDRDEAGDLGEQMRRTVEELMPAVKGRTLHLTVSIGVAFILETTRNAQQVLSCAFSCCSAAQKKRDGKGNAVHLHDPLDDVAAGSTEAILLSLRQALEQNGFLLQYQPLLNLEDENESFFEVFVKLPQKYGDPILPDVFMGVAAQSGLANKVDRWVIYHALRAVAERGEPIRLLINISGYSLDQDDLVPWIARACKSLKVPPSSLVFQITEGDANNFLKQAQTFAAQVTTLGAGFSISRFAGGINPFKLLQHLPVTMVKFEGTYTQELGKQDSREKFAELLTMASEAGKKVVVGFVESAQQMQQLWTLGGIHYLQGYYLQAPSATLGAVHED